MSHLRPVNAQEPLLSRRSLAERLECSIWTVDRMRAEGMPSLRWGRQMLRFRYSDVIRWIESQHEEAA